METDLSARTSVAPVDHQIVRRQYGLPGGEQGYVRRRSAHVEHKGIFGAGRHQGHHAHDAGGGAGKQGFHRPLAGHRKWDGSPVGLQKIGGRVDAHVLQAGFHRIREPVVQRPDRRVPIGRGNAARKIQAARQTMPERDHRFRAVRENFAYDLRHRVLMRRIARRKLGDAGERGQPFLPPAAHNPPYSLPIRRRDFRPPVIHAAGNERRMASQPEPARIKARPRADQQTHRRAGVLHHGIHGEGGPERRPAHVRRKRRSRLEQRVQGLSCGNQQILMVGGNFDGREQRSAAQQHGVGMRSAHIQPEHGRGFPFF